LYGKNVQVSHGRTRLENSPFLNGSLAQTDKITPCHAWLVFRRMTVGRWVNYHGTWVNSAWPSPMGRHNEYQQTLGCKQAHHLMQCSLIM